MTYIPISGKSLKTIYSRISFNIFFLLRFRCSDVTALSGLPQQLDRSDINFEILPAFNRKCFQLGLI